jgi:hypothetical protein
MKRLRPDACRTPRGAAASARPLVLAAACLLLGACSWGIRLDAGGEKVRAAWNEDVRGCRDMGQVTVSVLDHVGPIDRNDLAIRDELEVMARNEAATLGADTVKPLAEPRDGEQRWGAWHCGRERRAPMRIEQRDREGNVETFPVKEH